MRRAARLVASILVLAATLGQSIAIGSTARLGVTSEGKAAVGVPSRPVGEIANTSTSRRLLSAAPLNRSESVGLAAAALEATRLRSLGQYQAPSSGFTPISFVPAAASGRAPPLSR